MRSKVIESGRKGPENKALKSGCQRRKCRPCSAEKLGDKQREQKERSNSS